MNETTLNNILNKINLNSSVLVVHADESKPDEILVNRIPERSVSLLDVKTSSQIPTTQSNYDLIVSLNGDSNYEVYFKILKPNGILLLTETEGLESSLKLNGFQSYQKEDSFVTAQKPNFEVGSSQKLNFKKKVWQFTQDDMEENDLINTDDLLDDLDLKKPQVVDKFDCGTSASGKKKACKNCVCGLAEEIENEAQQTQKTNKEATVKSSCGSCYLGDAFRCASCPYLGMPAFKPGEKMNPTEDWIYVEHSSEIFRKTKFYDLKWNIENTLVKSGSFAGPIAITRDLNKPDVRPFVSVYSQSGYSIKTFQLEDKSQIIGIGWTCMEDLIVILENGEIQIRSMFGQLKSLFNVIKDSRAIDYRIFNTINTYSGTYTTGCVIQTAKNKFILVRDVYDPKLQQFPDIPGSLELDSWCIISTDKKCFILASRGVDIYQISYGGTPQLLKLNLGVQFTSIKKMCPSFTNDFIALNTDSGFLIMCNSDLNRIVHKYQAETTEPVVDIAWVSNKAVLALWDNLYLIPLEGDNIRNHYEIYLTPPCYLVQEIDGVRVLSSNLNEIIQVVPKPLRDIFEIAALDSSSALYESSIAFYENKNQKAEEYIRSIKEKGSLEDAISNCIQAAPHEFNTKYQVELLRAALFGRYFDDYANAAPYVKMCQTIRVLNSVRLSQIGLPLTYVQYEALTPNVIINRLITRRHFALAIEISKYLNMTDEEGIIKILSSWALYKVAQTDVEDDRIAVMIKSKLGDTPGISYAEIARCAIGAGRPGLAIKLLEYETKASEQVPLYIEIDYPELALKKAMESGDSDLIYMVLFWYQNKFNNISDFMKDISKKYPVAFNLMLQYYRQKNTSDQDSSELGNILNQENLITEQVCSIIRVALKQQRPDQKLQMFDEAKRLFANKEVFNTSLLNDEIKLIKIQMNLEKNYRRSFDGKSLYETIGELISLNCLDEAEKLRKEFKIADSSDGWWHLKAKCLCRGSLWDELEKFSKSKKSPIGYEPFVTFCMDMNNVQEAKKYFPKVSPENRFKCLIKMKCLTDALDLAYQSKDIQQINLVIGKCDSTTQKVLIDKAKVLRNELIHKQT